MGFRLVANNHAVFAAQPPAVHRGAVEAYISGASHNGLRTDQLGMLVDPRSTPAGQVAFYRQIAEADVRFTDEIQSRYSTIDLPVKIVWGGADTWIPVERAHELGRAIPGSSVEIIADAGHMIQLDAPAELAVALHRWLLRQQSVG